MKKWGNGNLLFYIMIILVLAQCVPVEEKIPAPFDISLRKEDVRKIYGMQVRQQKDSLLANIKSDNPSIRYAVARAFASFRDSTVLDALLPLLTDQQDQVRAMAAIAIGQIGSAKAEAHLTSAFDGRDSARLYEEANSAILEAMGKIGSAQFLRALGTISTYQPSDTLLLLGQARGIYRYALRNMTDPEGTATMVKYLSDEGIPFSVRLIAANYLHRAAGIDLAPHTDQLLADWQSESDPFLRMCLATALGKLKTTAANKILIESFKTETDDRVKSNILRALQGYDYNEIRDLFLEAAKSSQAGSAEVAAQFFVNQGKEHDAEKYKTTITQCKTWQAKTRMAEAANKNMASMFSSSKISLGKDILAYMNQTSNVYEKAAWLKAWGSEIRNFESLPKYIQPEQQIPVRTQAVECLIDVCKDSNFDSYFGGEGYLIRSQIGGYLANAMRQNDPGILAQIADAITDPKTGLKTVMSDRKGDLSKALSNLKLPEEMETYIELSKALKEYNIDSPPVPEEKKGVKTIDWKIIDALTGNSKALIQTSLGEITIALFPERAPGSVSNFIQLVNEKFFDDKAFHRVVPNFVIQTGCPRGDGFGSLDFTIRSEVAGAFYDDQGYVGMASAGPHTEGTQFFITHSPAPHLDGRYTIFGKVIEGMDIVQQIGMGDKINTITILY
jgi:cyclophilin family peptidyl-prolyl cis-trans isomerase/HEAT repeat protein